MFGGNFAPAGWMTCEGQILPISEYETLFQLIGTTYGGDGESTFALPNLASRVPLHMGTSPSGINYNIGQAAGQETVTLNTQQIPVHTHALVFTTTDQQLSPLNAIMAQATSTQSGVRVYTPGPATTTFNPNTIQPTGGSQPHENLQPYLAFQFIISLFGIYPSPT